MSRWLGLVLRSFAPAWAGLRWGVKSQRNVQVHVAATMVVIIAGLALHIAAWEWCVVILAGGLVWSAELLNTALEVLCDRVSTAHEEAIGRVKDVAAAAVLMAALAALVIALIIFLPKLWCFI